MSRRTRTRVMSCRSRLARVHHTEYNASESSFPESYSQCGLSVMFPDSIRPFLKGQEMHFVGTMAELLAREEDALFDYNGLQTVCVSFRGAVSSQPSTFLNSILLYASLPCYCVKMVFNLDWYRRCFFVQYGWQEYGELAMFIRRVGQCRTLVINIQDNGMCEEKVCVVDRELCESNIRDITVRNMSYRMGEQKNLFTNIRRKRGVQFRFIWENIIIKSNFDEQSDNG